MARNVNDETLKKIKQWEGLVLFAYDDFDSPRNRRKIKPGDVVKGTLTIGYGHTGPDVKPGMVISEREASELLRKDLDVFEAAVERNVKVPLNDNQFGAMTAFVLNVGEGNFKKSTLLKKLNAGQYDQVPIELQKYVYSKGKKLEGLINRRNAEIGLWNKGAFVSTRTIEAKPKKETVVTKENVTWISSILATLGSAFSTGPVQYALAAIMVIGFCVALYWWWKRKKENET